MILARVVGRIPLLTAAAADGGGTRGVVLELVAAGFTELALPPLGPDIAYGTPPDNIISWSPNGRRIAFYDETWIRQIRLGAAHPISKPLTPRGWVPPAFLDLLQKLLRIVGKHPPVDPQLAAVLRQPVRITFRPKLRR